MATLFRSRQKEKEPEPVVASRWHIHVQMTGGAKFIALASFGSEKEARLWWDANKIPAGVYEVEFKE